jgi:hypothetical protein
METFKIIGVRKMMKDVILDELRKRPNSTIPDLVSAGLEKGRPLQETLRQMEKDGLIISRLPNRDTPLRLYSKK